MNNGNKLLVLLPTLNEECTIRQTIEDVREFAPRNSIIVVVDSSTDKTAKIANEAQAMVIGVPKLGKGRTLRDALLVLPTLYPDTTHYIMLDGDFTYPARYIPKMLDMLEQGADTVMGYRKKREAGAMTRTNLFGNVMLSLIAQVLYGYGVKDICTGMWGFRREAIDRFKLTSNGFTLEADLFQCAVKTGCKVTQFPIRYRARPDGSTAKLAVFDGVKIGWFLLSKRFQ